jgi:hypothetical protein
MKTALAAAAMIALTLTDLASLAQNLADIVRG